MEAAATDDFWNQFAGSSSANLLTIVAIGLIMGLRKLCSRESKCKTHVHCPCIDVDVRDKTLHSVPADTDEDGPNLV